MTYRELVNQIDSIIVAKVSIRKDKSYSENFEVGVFIVEISIFDYDLFYGNIPSFAEFIFRNQSVSDAIKKFCRCGIPYTISFPLEIE